MIIWRGYGILVLIIGILGYVGGKIGAESIWGSPLPSNYRPGTELVSMLVAGALVYGLHLFLEAKNQPRILLDQASGQQVQLKRKDDLFYIPVKFWALIFAVLGVVFFFQ